MEKILKKQQENSGHTLYGMTPLYYLFLPLNEKMMFNEIIVKSIKPIGFVEALLEVIQLYEDFYLIKDTKSLTEEQIEFLNSPDISALFLNLMSNFKGPAKELREIRESYYYNNEIYEDFKVGEISFKDLMGVTNGKFLLEHLNGQISRNNTLTKDELSDTSPSAIAKKTEVVGKLEKLLEDIIFAIDKIEGQIRMIEGTSKTELSTSEMQNYFEQICNLVENTDNVMMGRSNDGTINQTNKEVASRILVNCFKIGFDVSINIAGEMFNNARHISNTRKEYNQSKINSLTDQKRIFSVAKTSIVTAIHNIKKGEERNMFYF